MSEAILGLSAFYHDSAAAILVDGEILAAAHEERFTRTKHDSSFPANATRYVLEEAGLRLEDLAAVAFYDKPLLKFERLLETYHQFSPRGLKSFLAAMPLWIKEKLFLRQVLKEELGKIGPGNSRHLLFPEHHLSHAAGAFYPSPFQEAAIVTIDGVGEWATTTIGHGKGKDIQILLQLDFPHSLGLLYSAFTSYCGFKVNSGEYKLMGLAPYGDPQSADTIQWMRAIRDELVDIRQDGSFLLNMDYFEFATGLSMFREDRWKKLFGISPRKPESELTQPYMDLALAIQRVTEEIVCLLTHTAREWTGCENLVMAGGVALNCVANSKVLEKRTFKGIWVQPAAGDAGGALGAAYAAWHVWKQKERRHDVDGGQDAMKGAYLGPEFSGRDIVRMVRRCGAALQEYSDFDRLCEDVAGAIAKGRIVGWFQGRMEYGPRALGNRSILGDPRHPEMQKKLNLRIKYREGFRPFAPAVLEEDLAEYFDLDGPSPYMLFTAALKEERRKPLPEGYQRLQLWDRLYWPRSDIPAVTHVDYSARIQTVGKSTNERFWKLIKAFKKETGCGILVNTSFNVRGEPIVCTPEDAYRCFMKTEMDCLVIHNYMFHKADQPSGMMWEGMGTSLGG